MLNSSFSFAGQKNKHECGATILENALVIPLFFMLMLVFVDFSRYLFAKNIMDAAAQEALSIAVATVDIEGNDADFDAAVARIEAKAKSIISASFITIGDNTSLAYLKDGAAGFTPMIERPGPQQREKLATDPIEIALAGEFIPIFRFFPTLELKGYAAGYREPRSEISLATPVDCNLRAITDADYNKGCPCLGPGGTKDNPNSTAFRNANTRECTCPFNKLLNPDGTCGCNFANAGAEVVEDPTGCRCAEHWRYVFEDGKCKCGNGHVENEDGSCGPCGAGLFSNDDPSDSYMDYGANGDGYCVKCENWEEMYRICKALNPPRGVLTPQDSGGECSCNMNYCDRKTFNGTAVHPCPGETVLSTDTCECVLNCISPFVEDSSGTICTCSLTECADGEMIDQKLCQCVVSQEIPPPDDFDLCVGGSGTCTYGQSG